MNEGNQSRQLWAKNENQGANPSCRWLANTSEHEGVSPSAQPSAPTVKTPHDCFVLRSVCVSFVSLVTCRRSPFVGDAECVKSDSLPLPAPRDDTYCPLALLLHLWCLAGCVPSCCSHHAAARKKKKKIRLSTRGKRARFLQQVTGCSCANCKSNFHFEWIFPPVKKKTPGLGHMQLQIGISSGAALPQCDNARKQTAAT